MRVEATISCLLLGLSFIAVPLNAQELHVYYNLFNDSVVYKVDGKVLEEPKLKNGQEIQLHLTEFNNFLYDIELEIKQEDSQQSSGIMEVAQFAGLGPGLPGMGLGIGGERAGASGGLGLMGLADMPLLKINDSEISLQSIFGGSRGSAQMLEQANTAMAEITAIKEEVLQLTQEIQSYEKSREVGLMALAHIDSLKKHPNLRPSFIKKRCEEYYRAIFHATNLEGITLDELLAIQQTPMRYKQAVKKLNAREATLRNKVALLSGLNEQFVNLALDDADYLKYVANLQTFRKDAQSISQQLKEALSVDGGLDDFPSKQDLTNLQFSLAEVISNDFTYHSRTQAYSDILNINIKMVKKEHPLGEEKEVVKSRNLRLEAKGGLKVTASVGLNFSQFLTAGQTFSARDNLIVADNAGVFSPTAASMLHFYTYNGKKLSLGGSFGIGFPMLAGEGESQSLHFFIGPSLIFGTKQRMVLNMGLMGGRATRLAKGYKPGDYFDDSFGDIPTRNPYEIGLFIGTSFNIMGN